MMVNEEPSGAFHVETNEMSVYISDIALAMVC